MYSKSYLGLQKHSTFSYFLSFDLHSERGACWNRGSGTSVSSEILNLPRIICIRHLCLEGWTNPCRCSQNTNDSGQPQRLFASLGKSFQITILTGVGLNIQLFEIVRNGIAPPPRCFLEYKSSFIGSFGWFSSMPPTVKEKGSVPFLNSNFLALFDFLGCILKNVTFF